MKHILLLISILCMTFFVNAQQPLSIGANYAKTNSKGDYGKVPLQTMTDNFNIGKTPFVNENVSSIKDNKSVLSECLISLGGNDLYHFTISDPTNPVPYGISSPVFLNCAEYVDGQYYATSSAFNNLYLYQIDPETGALTFLTSSNNCIAIAYNITNSVLYGISNNYILYTINTTSGAETQIGYLPSNVYLSMTIDNTGRCFVVRANNDCISEINLNTLLIIGSMPVGFDINYGQDITCDRETNEIYWAAYNASVDKAQLYKVDYDNNTLFLISTFSTQATCFASKTEYNPNRPSTPDNFTAIPSSGLDLTCNLSWTNPVTSINGSSLSKIDEIILMRNNSVIYQNDNVAIGENMNYHDNIEIGGEYTYHVYAVNDGISGIVSSVTVHVGHPVINVTPTSIVSEVNSMHNDTADIVINNNGSDKLTYYINCESDAKYSNSVAYCAIGGQNMYSFELNKPYEGTSLGYIAPEFLNSMCYVDGIYYFATSTSGLFGTFDPETGTFTTIKTGNNSGSIAYNPVDGNLYGIQLGSGAIIYSIDPATGDETQVITATNSNFVLGLEFNNDGRCFVIDATIDGISEINTTTGEFTTIAHHFNINYGQDLSCDRETNTLYWAAYNADDLLSQLWSVDVDNNSMTMIGIFPNQASGFAIPSNPKWLSANKHSGTINAGESETVKLIMNGWYADSGTFSGNCKIVNNSLTPEVNIPVTFTINKPLCNAPTNLTVDVVNFNNMHLSWTAPENHEGLSHYGIYYGTSQTPFVSVDSEETFFDDDDLAYDEYCYKVRAFYDDGCISLSPQQVCVEATAPYGVVSGKITSSLTNQLVSGATVTFQGNTTLTAQSDEDGNYSLNVYEGTYKVIASAYGYCNDTLDNIVITTDSYNNLDFALGQPIINVDPDSINVSVVSMHDGDAQVSITNNGNSSLSWKTDILSNHKSDSIIAYVTLNGYNIYKFPLNDPDNLIATGFVAPGFVTSMCYVDGTYYFACSNNGLFGIFDPETGAFTTIKTGNHSGSIAYNPTDGNIYGVSLFLDSKIYLIDPSIGEETYISSLPLSSSSFILCMEIDNNGRCFMIKGYSANSELIEVNINTGNIIDSFNVGFDARYGQDLDCDRETNTIYWAAYNATIGQAQLYTFDIDNKSIQMIGTFPKQASGFAIPASTSTGWLFAYPHTGIVDAGQSDTLSIKMNGWYANEGNLNATCCITNNTVAPSIAIPVSFTIDPSECDPVQNFTLDVVDYNTMHLAWSAPENDDNLVGYNIYRNNDKNPYVTLDKQYTLYNDNNLVIGRRYTYKVGAVYSDSCISLSKELYGKATIQYGQVSGTVTNSINGESIQNAVVQFEGNIVAITDKNGQYSIDVPIGIYHNIAVKAIDFSTYYVKTYEVVLHGNSLDIQLDNLYNSVDSVVSHINTDTVTLLWNQPKAHLLSYELNEGFENYNVGEPIVEQAGYPWEYITEGSGCDISDKYAHTGNKSLNIYGFDAYTGCNLGDKTSGHYILSMYMYLEQDTLENQWAYLAVLHQFINGDPVEACDIWIYGPDYAFINVNEITTHFNVNYNEWIHIVFDIDLDNDWALFKVNDRIIYEWQFSLPLFGDDPNMLKLYGLDFDGDMKKRDMTPQKGNYFQLGNYYLDDITFEDISANPVIVGDPTGYNITRGNNLVSTSTDTTFTETGLHNGTYNYCVSANYLTGESDPVCVDAVVNYAIKGDANDDGYVDISDIQSVIAFILNQNPTPWNFVNADVNSDGNVNMADIQCIVNIILGMKSGACSNSDATVTYMIQNDILYINTPVELSAFQIGFNSSDVEALGVLDGFETVESWNNAHDKFYLLSYNMNHYSLQPGTYALMKVGDAELEDFVLSDPNGCVVNTKQGNILGIEEVSLDYVKPYPNPFTGTVTIPYTVNHSKDNISVMVSDVFGHIVYENNITNAAIGKYTVEWTPQNIACGIYFVTVQINGQESRKSKLVYEK